MTLRLLLFVGIFCLALQSYAQQDFGVIKVSLKVRDAGTGSGLDDSTWVRIVNLSRNWVDSNVVKNGFVDFWVEKGFKYGVSVKRRTYFMENISFDMMCHLDDPSKMFCLTGGLVESLSEDAQGTKYVDAGVAMKKIVINYGFHGENVYYNLDEFAIRHDASWELDKLVKLLRDNPEILVELSSHTDSRGSWDYNMELSQKRSEAVVEYLVQHGGIEAYRLQAKGYGESKPINHCVDGVHCSETEHEKNRRTEIKIIGIK